MRGVELFVEALFDELNSNLDALGSLVPKTSTYGTIDGGYVKIGNQVTINIKITFTTAVSALTQIVAGNPVAKTVYSPLNNIIISGTGAVKSYMYADMVIVEPSSGSIPVGSVVVISGSYITD